jgi:F0F1-type ATP synthase membrane subunit c/vacuolar-type H+-ATPase subunit K
MGGWQYVGAARQPDPRRGRVAGRVLISAQFADAVGLLVMVSILLIRPRALSREAV